MRCHGCGSEQHLISKCPNRKGKGKGGKKPHFLTMPMQGSLPTDKDWFPTTGTATSSAGIWRGVTESGYFVQDESSVHCEELPDEDIATFWHEVDMSAHGASSSSTPKQGTQVFCLADDDEEPHEESASSSMKSNTPLWHFLWWKVDASENQRCDENYLVRTRMKELIRAPQNTYVETNGRTDSN